MLLVSAHRTPPVTTFMPSYHSVSPPWLFKTIHFPLQIFIREMSVNFPPYIVDCVWIVMAHAQKPDFVFRRNGRFHLNQQGRQFSRLLAAEMCASAVVILDTPSSEVVWRVLATHSIRQFPLHFPSRASPCAITFQLDSTLSIQSMQNSGIVARVRRRHLPHKSKMKSACLCVFVCVI